MIASLEEVIGQLFIFEAGSRINTNSYYLSYITIPGKTGFSQART